MILLVHHDDGKQKYQSHEVYCKEESFYSAGKDLFSRNPFEITGYGSTKDEALQDFIRKMDWVVNEWEAFRKLLIETPYYDDNIEEVDVMGQLKPFVLGEVNE